MAVKAARKVGLKARKHVAPMLPALVTPVALGAALSAGALVLFFRLADDIREQEGVWRFDHDGLRLALALRNPRRTLLMRAVSDLCRPDVMSGLGVAALGVAYLVPRQRPKAVLLAVTLAGGGAIIGGIKTRFARARPNLIEALAKEGTFSFPSGHAFIALCFYGVLASWWNRARPDPVRRIVVGTSSTAWILLIGASRVYLGVHYPSDVLAGYAAAVPWLTACQYAYHRFERRVEPLLFASEADDETDDEGDGNDAPARWNGAGTIVAGGHELTVR
jgi:undecaprenyl-diphosphatase